MSDSPWPQQRLQPFPAYYRSTKVTPPQPSAPLAEPADIIIRHDVITGGHTLSSANHLTPPRG